MAVDSFCLDVPQPADLDGSKLPPLIVHVDVNKTLVIVDSIMNKSTEYTIREVIAKQFYGEVQTIKSEETGESRTIWKWDGRGPSLSGNKRRPTRRNTWGIAEKPRRSVPSPKQRASNEVRADEEGRANKRHSSLEVRRPGRRPNSMNSMITIDVTPPIAHTNSMSSQFSDCPDVESKTTMDIEKRSYLKFLRDTIQDVAAVRLATRSFERVLEPECKQQMLALAEQAVAALQIPQGRRTQELQDETGLVGEWRFIFPSFFRLIAQLQTERRHFTVIFRSFGTDLMRVQAEWNAFCEGRHPLLKESMEGLPKMDGSVEGVPDRRVAEGSIHTMYRDAQGPLLALGVNASGTWEGEWDQWARSGSQVDTRGGRLFMREQCCETITGYMQLQTWFKDQVMESRSSIIREDFAWWTHNRENSTAGKLMIGIEGVQQVFFDDNILPDECRIVDPRFALSFLPVPSTKCLGRSCIQVDTLQAMLSENYFIETFFSADLNVDFVGPRCGSPCTGIKVRRKSVINSAHATAGSGLVLEGVREEAEDLAFGEDDFDEGGSDYCSDSCYESMEEDEEDDDEQVPLEVTDLDALRELLASSGVDLSRFGAPGTTYKTVDNLHQELMEKKCVIKRINHGNVRVRREMEVMRMKLMFNNLILVETHEQLPDGRLRSRNGYLPATKKRHGETLLEIIDRWAIEELQVNLTQEQKAAAVTSRQHKYDVTEETMSYPLPCATHYLEVCCHLEAEQMPRSVLDRLGLPAGTMFSTRGMKKKKPSKGGKDEAGPMRFWSWYRAEVWEAMTLSQDKDLPDIQETLEELFEGHSRRNAYSALLLQMFDCFSASKLCGGLSGSLVLQVQPVDPIDGKNEEAVIVKLDKADVISREIANSKRVYNALSDRAARIFGQGCFWTDSTSVEYGAFKIELAGGCWQVPELTGGSRTKDLLMTFKDLLNVESQRQLLDTDMHHLVSTSGDVELVLFELLGPGGMLRVLRREPLARSPRNLFGSFVYRGKDTKWNPLCPPDYFQLNLMQELWRRSFGARGAKAELPDVRERMQDLRNRFSALEHEHSPLGRYKPITGFAHGDLNAMNVLIDVMDAVWLIDFAFSEEKPLSWDLAKMEIAFMFEYAVLPVSWRTLLDFAGDSEEVWRARKVHTWLGVSEPVAYALLEELLNMHALHKTAEQAVPEVRGNLVTLERVMSGRKRSTGFRKLPKRRASAVNDKTEYGSLQKAILRACESCYRDQNMDRSKEKKRDTEFCRLCALLLATREEEEAALECAAAVARAMLLGDTLQTVMEPPPLRLQRDEGASLSFCWTKVARLRLFFKEEWLELRRRAERELGPLHNADESPLVHWLGLLQESYRVLGYFDVAPWVKVWAIFFLDNLISCIERELNIVKDTALGRLQLDARRASKAVAAYWIPRPYPTEMDMASRLLAQKGGTPCPLTSRRRIRLLHAKSGEIGHMGGIFAEVRSLASVTVDGRAVRTELLRGVRTISDGGGSDCSDEDHSIVVELRGGTHDRVELGNLILPSVEGMCAQLTLTVPLVPLSENLLSQQDRRRGVRAYGETPRGQEVQVVFAVTETAFCYPPGQRLSMAPNNIAPLRSGMRLQLVTVGEFNERSGNYSVSCDNVEKNAFEETEADPFEGNHLQVRSLSYNEGTKLTVLSRNSGGMFVDVVVAKAPQKEGSVRHLLDLDLPAADKAAGSDKAFHLDLNDFNYARRHPRLSAEVLFDEARKFRVFAKAKHSFIYTVTSERADVLEGPVPHMCDETGRETFFWSEVQALISEDDERLSSHIFFTGTLILGEPGSGKSSLLCKLAMHCLSHSTMLLPVLIPVIDLCSRLQKAGQQGVSLADEHSADGIVNDAEGLVEWYLRMVYGGDTNRFFMLRQALDCHRLLLLFDGLEEAGPCTTRIESCITGLVALNHRVVATARILDEFSAQPKDPSFPRWRSQIYPSWLKTAPQLFRVMELLPLELECRRSLVEALLAREQGLSVDDMQIAVDFVEDFILHLDEDEGRKWSTPMMVSMLVASWREKKRQEDRRAKKATTPHRVRSASNSSREGASGTTRSSGVDVREVYRVALDLLLRRFQSRRQADRHKVKDTVQKFKELLEIIAVNLPPETEEFTEETVLPLLGEYDLDLQVWKDLSEAIRQGRVPLLQTKTDPQANGQVRFVFTYGSFQRFLSAASTRSLVWGKCKTPSMSGTCESPRKRVEALMLSEESQGLDFIPELRVDRVTSANSASAVAERLLSPRRLSQVVTGNGFFWNICTQLMTGWSCCFSSRDEHRSPRRSERPRGSAARRESSPSTLSPPAGQQFSSQGSSLSRRSRRAFRPISVSPTRRRSSDSHTSGSPRRKPRDFPRL